MALLPMKNASRRAVGAGLFAAVCSFSIAVAAAAGDPAITFDYSALFDGPCYAALHTSPDTAAIDGVRTHLAEWRAEWAEEAPVLLGATVKLTGRPFKFHEATAAIITCPAFPAMSFPLLLNVRRVLTWLAAGTGPRHGFSQVLLHEVLHRYVSERLDEFPDRRTPTLLKYKDEPQVVRSHLYNVAIMDEVYRELGRDADAAAMNTWLASVGAIPGMRGASDMQRALEIIKKETPAALVRELAGK
jgi:hypothetical protein